MTWPRGIAKNACHTGDYVSMPVHWELHLCNRSNLIEETRTEISHQFFYYTFVGKGLIRSSIGSKCVTSRCMYKVFLNSTGKLLVVTFHSDEMFSVCFLYFASVTRWSALFHFSVTRLFYCMKVKFNSNKTPTFVYVYWR